MLHFQIEFTSGLSVYRQLAEQIRYYIASGVLAAGDKLPSVRGLSKELGINPATVVKAYNTLQNENLIELKQGRGAFIRSGLLMDAVKDESSKDELMLKIKSVAVLANKIKLPINELLDIIEKTYQEINHD